MNILEHYIVEIHSVEPYEAEWTKKYDKEFLEVELTVNCYGAKEKTRQIYDVEEWEKVKEQGYYMG